MNIKNNLAVVGRRIKSTRLMRKLSLRELAKKASISKGNLSKMENGPANIGLDTLYKIARALKVEAKELLP